MSPERFIELKRLSIPIQIDMDGGRLKECIEEIERLQSALESRPALTCFKCGDGSTPLYCLNCAGDLLKPAPCSTAIPTA